MRVTGYKGRYLCFDVSMFDAAGDLISIAGTDNIRVKIGDTGVAPLLDLESLNDTAAGSNVSQANPTRVTIYEADLDLSGGTYDLEVLVVDDSEEDQPKHVQQGVLDVVVTQLGDTDL